MATSRILVADDDEAVLESVAWLLQENGYDVVPANGGVSCIEQLEKRAPDLILLDILMPDADGCQLLERIKGDDRWRDLPVLMLSAQPPEEASVKSLGLGAADFIRKPYRPKELLARVQAQLRMGALLRSTRAALMRTEEQLVRAQQDADSRRKLVDILHEVTGDLSVSELFHLLVRRAARALGVSHCSVVLARPGEPQATVVAAFENPGLQHLPVQLERYPELKAALDSGQPVLVEDLDTHPLYEGVRHVWGIEGLEVPIRSVIALPFSIDRGQYGVFLVRRTRDQERFGPADLEFAQAVITAAVAVIQRAQMVESTMADNARLEQLAQTDPLTQLLNRRALTERIAAEMERTLRYDSTMALLMIDLDHFKRVNDTYGHLVGDDVLRDVAPLLSDTIRTADIVARYGGEEFLVLLPETDDAGAESFADRIRRAIETHPFASDSLPEPLRLTASIGVAVYPAARIESVEDLFARADAALYRAKADGRNRVRL
ncbi:MAG: diguanylate cyclase [Gemmatimonas sp.]|jgi:two-component system cell cycle response regulator|uniref:diguanylate cyclase n=1 Tax=Gemmatimonas sp. TaxID=1962908 RepID=UPI0022C66DEE|nr:diguanylate cyclase [Gemmatimonas sp.]MCA2986155.1 diguanylate cyclase [Gemmatimonas sp.]MCA2993734.1 diguanylate cyclase [Gemmatimonas sp.]MCE2953066.1 diguanylate cyclase [Gemmatimonas sp.]MCZ8011681.1 diguanylate cyclase [Gemmatimonas sp.]MCZ8265770.1 diguanylate cyclase [Gemmatimonas sp.]